MENVEFSEGSNQFANNSIAIVKSIANTGVGALALYPNPAKDNLVVSFNLSDNGHVQIEVLDVMGKRVISQDFDNLSSGQNQQEINVANLSNGNYSLVVKTSQSVELQQFVIIK